MSLSGWLFYFSTNENTGKKENQLKSYSASHEFTHSKQTKLKYGRKDICNIVKFPAEAEYWCRVQPRERPQEGICDGVQDSGCPGNIRKMYIGCPHPHRPEPGGMGHMEQGHSELFWVARALQLTPGTVI